MAFIIDKEELKPGLIIFRRTDVGHRNWYCRIKLPKADRYKTYSLKTPNVEAAKDRAFDYDADVRFRLKHDVPVFNRPFIDVAREYLATQVARAKRCEISAERPKKLRAIIEGALNDYMGATQVHLIGDELWGGYPGWRRENGAGRYRRNGTREVSTAMAATLAEKDTAARAKALQSRGIRHVKATKAVPAASLDDNNTVAFISDSTIKLEMSIFGAVMNFAIKKRYAPRQHALRRPPQAQGHAPGRVQPGGIPQAAYGRPPMDQGGHNVQQRLVSDRHLQFHPRHVQYGDATERGKEPALARHHARKGSRRP